MKNVVKKKNKGLINTYRTFRSFFFKNLKFLKKKKLFYFVKYQNKLKKKKYPLFFLNKLKLIIVLIFLKKKIFLIF